MDTNGSVPVLPDNLSRVYEAGSDHQMLGVEFRGHVTARAMGDVVQTAQQRLPDLRRGFSVLVDLTRLEKMDLDGAPLLAAMMDAFRAAGVGKIVRVIPDDAKDIGFNILSNIHYRGQVPITTVRSLAEAVREFESF